MNAVVSALLALEIAIDVANLIVALRGRSTVPLVALVPYAVSISIRVQSGMSVPWMLMAVLTTCHVGLHATVVHLRRSKRRLMTCQRDSSDRGFIRIAAVDRAGR